ncbi:MAG: CBS domain-containing protein [Acidimicrobiales bacterium]
MLRELPVRDVMVTDVLVFSPEDNVMDAMRSLLIRNIDGAPVVNADGDIVGLLSTSDLIVEEARVHLPTVITLLGAYIELPSSKKQFDKDVEKALGSTVGEVMGDAAPTISPEDTVEYAATVMHEQGADRLPILDESGALIGIVARGDIVRAIVAEWDAGE